MFHISRGCLGFLDIIENMIKNKLAPDGFGKLVFRTNENTNDKMLLWDRRMK